jgi:hypothetical protein
LRLNGNRNAILRRLFVPKDIRTAVADAVAAPFRGGQVLGRDLANRFGRETPAARNGLARVEGIWVHPLDQYAPRFHRAGLLGSGRKHFNGGAYFGDGFRECGTDASVYGFFHQRDKRRIVRC